MVKIVKFTKWSPHRPKVSTSFKKFNFVAKTKNGLKRMIKKNPHLSKVMDTVFSRKTFKYVAGAALVGVGIDHVMNYIESNSGCFLKSQDTVCKVRDLSCCQKEEVKGVSFCDTGNDQWTNACNNFDEDKEKTCCRLCSCDKYPCLPDQTMECQRPTVGEALTHFAETLTMGALTGMLSWLPYVLYTIGGCFLLWILYKLFIRR